MPSPLSILVRNLEPDVGFAWNYFHNADTDDGQRTRNVLCQTRNLTDFDTRGWIQFEACDDGTWRYGLDFDFDAEIAQLELDETRHRLQRLLRIPFLLRWGIVEQHQWR